MSLYLSQYKPIDWQLYPVTMSWRILMTLQISLKELNREYRAITIQTTPNSSIYNALNQFLSEPSFVINPLTPTVATWVEL